MGEEFESLANPQKKAETNKRKSKKRGTAQTVPIFKEARYEKIRN
jgi:hypothetical protein